jgi:AcrR family transcriptional regulator
MRYSADQKAKSKKAILSAAGKRLKKEGFNGIGVDGLAAEAGVTSGAFYSNFSSKEELLKELVGQLVGHPFSGFESGNFGNLNENQKLLLKFIQGYLSYEHTANIENGCVIPALSADVARSGIAVRRVYQKRMNILIEKMTTALKGNTELKRRAKAWSILSIMVGAISISRALPEGEESREIIDAALESASSMITSL